MWKPGTRIQRVSIHQGDVGPRVAAIPTPIGALAMVANADPTPGNAAAGCDICVIPDHDPNMRDTRSKDWRPIDTNDSTGITSVEQLVQSLSKVTA